jgi:ribonuclease BN (tRNA processing enzyme)
MDYAYLTLTRWDQGAGQIPDLQVCGPEGIDRMTRLLFSEEGAYRDDLAGRTLHPGSHLIYEHRGGALPRQRPTPHVREVSGGATVDGGGWRVRVETMVHCQPYLKSVAYRFDCPEGSIVVTGDTAPNDALVEISRGANVILHMCHFLNDVETDSRITTSCSGHLDAARTAAAAGVETLVLIHLTEQILLPGIRERMLAEAAAKFDGTIVLGEDLMEVPLGTIQPEPIL